MGRHGERQPYVHAARVVLHGGVDEPLDLRERHDRVELAGDFVPRHPQNGAVQIDVLAARQLRMEARSYLDERPNRPTMRARPRVGAVIRDRILSSVDLPRRCRDDATTSPFLISNDTSSSAQSVVAASCAALRPNGARKEPRQRIAQHGIARRWRQCGSAWRRVRAWMAMSDMRSDDVGERAFGAVEEHETSGEEHQHHHR